MKTSYIAEGGVPVLTVTCLFFQARRPSLGYWDEGRLLLTFSCLSTSFIMAFGGEGQNLLTLPILPLPPLHGL